MKIKGEFIMRELVGEILLVPVGQTALQFNGMITLNPVSAQIWRSLEQGAPYEEILRSILDPRIPGLAGGPPGQPAEGAHQRHRRPRFCHYGSKPGRPHAGHRPQLTGPSHCDKIGHG